MVATGRAPPPISPYPQSNHGYQGSSNKEARLKDTIIIFITVGLVFSGIRYFIGWISGGITWGLWATYFGFSGLLMSLIYGAIGSGIGGLIFCYIFKPIRDFVKRTFLSKYIFSLFRLFWVPALVGFVLSALIAILGFTALGSSPLAGGILSVTSAIGGTLFLLAC